MAMSCKGQLRVRLAGQHRRRIHPHGALLGLYKILFRFKAVLWESLHPPFICKAYPITILLHDHWAIYALLPTLLLYAVSHTILVMAISCKGQCPARRSDSTASFLYSKRRPPQSKLAHIHEQSKFTDSAYLVAAGHL